MRYKYLTQAPYDAHPLKTTPVSSDVDLNYLRYLALERAQHEWLLNHESSAPAAINTTSDLMLSVLSTAGIETCRCMAFSDGQGYALTSHALRYWRTFTWQKAIPYATSAETNFKVGGLIGSIASYICITPAANSPDISDRIRVDLLLDAVWSELGLTRDILPATRLFDAATALNFDYEYVQLSAAALNKYNVTNVPQLRGYALDRSAITNLGLRLLLGEVSDQLISVWARLQISCNQNPTQAATYLMPTDSYQKPFHLLQMGLTVGRGGGWALLFQALYLEILLKIADTLAQFSDRDLTAFTSDLSTEISRQQLALYYAAASDCQNVLAAFGTIVNAAATAAQLWEQSQRWSATVTTSADYSDPGWRLAPFINMLLDIE